MHDKNNQHINIFKTLLQRTVDLKIQIQGYQPSIPFQSSIEQILAGLEQELLKEAPDRKKVEQYAYAIFRLVTESSQLENSSIGKELLSLLREIHELLD